MLRGYMYIKEIESSYWVWWLWFIGESSLYYKSLDISINN